jgi:hypothetical protein
MYGDQPCKQHWNTWLPACLISSQVRILRKREYLLKPCSFAIIFCDFFIVTDIDSIEEDDSQSIELDVSGKSTRICVNFFVDALDVPAQDMTCNRYCSTIWTKYFSGLQQMDSAVVELSLQHLTEKVSRLGPSCKYN